MSFIIDQMSFIIDHPLLLITSIFFKWMSFIIDHFDLLEMDVLYY